MSIQDLGSVGELVAAMATVITLLYLAIQIRANTTIARAQSLREMVNPPIEWSLLPATDAELAGLLRRAMTQYDTMGATEQFRFSQWLFPFFAHVETVWRMQRIGLMEEGPLEGYVKNCVAMMNSEGGGAWWAQYRSVTNLEFAEMLESRRDEYGDEVPSITELLSFFSGGKPGGN